MSKRNRIKTTEAKVQKVNKDQEKIRERSRTVAMGIYDKWKTRFINTPCPPDQLVTRLNELAAEIQGRVEDEDVKEQIIKMVELKMGDTYLAGKLGIFTMRVHAICPNTTTIGTEISICNWAGDTFVMRPEWQKKKAWISCPSCGQTIKQKSMKPVVVSKDQPPNN